MTDASRRQHVFLVIGVLIMSLVTFLTMGALLEGLFLQYYAWLQTGDVETAPFVVWLYNHVREVDFAFSKVLLWFWWPMLLASSHWAIKLTRERDDSLAALGFVFLLIGLCSVTCSAVVAFLVVIPHTPAFPVALVTDRSYASLFRTTCWLIPIATFVLIGWALRRTRTPRGS